MISFFDTDYVVRRPVGDVFDFFSDLERYLLDLPEFHGARLSSDKSPIVAGKVFWISVPKGDYPFRTRLELGEVSRPGRLVYDYQYTLVDSDTPLSAKDGPMPWDWARMILSFDQAEPDTSEKGTRVRAQMQVFGVSGFFSRWKTNALISACARAQKSANDNMVRVAENAIPSGV